MSEQNYNMSGVESIEITVRMGTGQVITLRCEGKDLCEGDVVTLYTPTMEGMYGRYPIQLPPRLKMDVGFTEGKIVGPEKKVGKVRGVRPRGTRSKSNRRKARGRATR